MKKRKPLEGCRDHKADIKQTEDGTHRIARIVEKWLHYDT